MCDLSDPGSGLDPYALCVCAGGLRTGHLPSLLPGRQATQTHGRRCKLNIYSSSTTFFFSFEGVRGCRFVSRIVRDKIFFLNSGKKLAIGLFG